MPRAKRHGAVDHKMAEAVIAHLIAKGGQTDEDNGEIVAILGITRDNFDRGRRHAMTCSLLGGFQIAYRKRGQPLVLIDPVNSGSSMLSVLLGKRTDPLFDGWDARKRQADTQRRFVVASIEAAAREAAGGGNKPLADCLGYAASDIAAYGDIQPATTALLSMMGVTTP